MIDAICELIKNRNNFVLVGHSNPDGDSIGSCYGLALALAKIGKTPVVLLDGPVAPKYEIIPGKDYLYNGKTENLEIDVLICLDCADPARLGQNKALLERAVTTVCIDHHETNQGFADYNIIDPNASSTSEMVFGLIERLTSLDADIASAIYAGIVCDTGGFRYSASAKSTLEIAGRLMETGIPFTKIYNEVFHEHSYAGAKILAQALTVSQQTMNGRITYAHITREMMKATGAKTIDLDGIVEYLMSTRGTDVAVLLNERVGAEIDEIKVSFRSNGLHVGRIAQSLGGGGHRMAAGCSLTGKIEALLPEVVSLVERELETYGE